MTKQQKIKKKNIEPKKEIIVSEKLKHGTVIETVLSDGQTKLAIYKDGKHYITAEEKLADGRTVVPMPASGALIKSGLIKFASKPAVYGSVDKLVVEIRDFIHRYVDLSDEFELIATYYVLLSWIYDDFNELPYLRKLGDFGSGKTRFLRVMAALCYKAVAASGGTSVASLFHITDKFKGTLILDEADYSFTDERSDIAKIMNNGNAKGFPILRVSQNADGKYTPISYDVFCPKVVASRSNYQDQALESRFVTENFRPSAVRSDIPSSLPASFETEALQIRNKLLSYRFDQIGKAKVCAMPDEVKLEGRIKQIFTPLVSVVEDEGYRHTLLGYAKQLSDQLQTERSMSLEAQVLTCIKKLQEEQKTLSVKTITNEFFLQFGDYYERRFTAKWVGSILRRRLNLSTYKSNGNYVLDDAESSLKLDVLYQRYSV